MWLNAKGKFQFQWSLKAQKLCWKKKLKYNKKVSKIKGILLTSFGDNKKNEKKKTEGQ